MPTRFTFVCDCHITKGPRERLDDAKLYALAQKRAPAFNKEPFTAAAISGTNRSKIICTALAPTTMSLTSIRMCKHFASLIDPENERATAILKDHLKTLGNASLYDYMTAGDEIYDLLMEFAWKAWSIMNRLQLREVERPHVLVAGPALFTPMLGLGVMMWSRRCHVPKSKVLRFKQTYFGPCEGFSMVVDGRNVNSLRILKKPQRKSAKR